MKDTKWRDGIYGLIVADAVGVPVEFTSRQSLKEKPVKGMREYGTHAQPKGTWSDDSSMVLAELAAYAEHGSMDFVDIMQRFSNWKRYGEYTPFHDCFDIGIGVSKAIGKFERGTAPLLCGGEDENDNGNGALMRILPFSLYTIDKFAPENQAVRFVHDAARLTHRHEISLIGCGLFHWCVASIEDSLSDMSEDMHELSNTGKCLFDRIKEGLEKGFKYYEEYAENKANLACYERLRNLQEFTALPEDEIYSSGYVVHTFEAAIYCLLNTTSYEEAVLKAVNLGDDTDTVAAVTGALAGLYYGYEDIPKDWIRALQKRSFIEEILREV